MSKGNNRPKLLLVELNEFDPILLRSAAERYNLTHLKRLLAMPHGTTTTVDHTEHHGLDPWVQWVNVHCGQPSSVHGVKRLGDTASQSLPQIWTALGEAGASWGVWGVMNAPRQHAPGCKFFFPDPWSFEEEAYPPSLNGLLSLPRYVSKNYLELEPTVALGKALRFAGRLLAPDMLKAAMQFAPQSLSQAARGRLSVHGLTTLLDYLSTLIFVDMRRKFRPHFSAIFLNNIAHLQHQFWKSGEDMHHEMKFGLELTNKMLGLLMRSLDDDEAIIVLNGLKQRNVDGEGICVYRQKQPQKMVEALGISGASVEQCMTHDAHILFDTVENAENAARVLASCKLSDGKRAFYVERVAPRQVFYQIDFEHAVADDVTLDYGNLRIPFGDVIELYAMRTGAHIPNADIYAQGIELPASMHNHEVYHLILQHMRSGAARQVETAS